jgi:histidyl-tRNA synthetase
VYDAEVLHEDLLALKRELIARGHRVRVERRQKNMKALLARIASEGFTSFANVRPGVRHSDELEFRELAG